MLITEILCVQVTSQYFTNLNLIMIHPVCSFDWQLSHKINGVHLDITQKAK